MKNLPQRKKNRLQGYDYSQNGAYFITICAKGHAELFGKIEPTVGARTARPCLSEVGQIVENAINNIPVIYPDVIVDCFVVMPNHVHLIFVIINIGNNIGRPNGRAVRAPTISTVINQMKGFVTKKIGFSPWQKSFHDHIIRDDESYRMIAQYVHNNPANWQNDCFYGL